MSAMNKIGHGPELYHEVQRLIQEWFGLDATVQTSKIPQLVKDILQVAEAHNEAALKTAAHDGVEAA